MSNFRGFSRKMAQKPATTDHIDLALCISVLALITLFSFVMFAREVFFIRHSHTQRTVILLLTFLNCCVLIAYTTMGRLFADSWSDLTEAIGDLITTAIAFLQYYLVVSWFAKVSRGIDECECDSKWFSFLLNGKNLLAALGTLAYMAGGLALILIGEYGVFNTYQDLVTFVSCLGFGICGTYFILRAHRNTNVLEMSIETYTVLRRSRVTSYVLLICGLFATVFSGLSLFGSPRISDYVNVMETKYYICHQVPCLVSFLIRVIFIVTLPNWALSYMFSSPPEQELHLVPLNGTSTSAGRSISKHSSSNPTTGYRAVATTSEDDTTTNITNYMATSTSRSGTAAAATQSGPIDVIVHD